MFGSIKPIKTNVKCSNIDNNRLFDNNQNLFLFYVVKIWKIRYNNDMVVDWTCYQEKNILSIFLFSFLFKLTFTYHNKLYDIKVYIGIYWAVVTGFRTTLYCK